MWKIKYLITFISKDLNNVMRDNKEQGEACKGKKAPADEPEKNLQIF